jgi:hypothetical protein
MQRLKVYYIANITFPNFSRKRAATTIWSSAHQWSEQLLLCRRLKHLFLNLICTRVALSTVQCVFLPNPSISIGRGRQNLVLPSFFKKLLPSALGEDVCRVWLIDGFQTPKIVKWLEEFQLQILDAISASYLCIWFCYHILRGKIVS